MENRINTELFYWKNAGLYLGETRIRVVTNEGFPVQPSLGVVMRTSLAFSIGSFLRLRSISLSLCIMTLQERRKKKKV